MERPSDGRYTEEEFVINGRNTRKQKTVRR
jgi:hypothetical protein